MTVGPDNSFPTHLSMGLSENSHGVFVLQIEDSNMEIDTYQIGQGAMLSVSAGKQSTQTTTMIKGLVRKIGYSRGADSKVFLNLIGSSTGIRLNENIIYFLDEANKLVTGEYDVTDTSMQAKTILNNALATELTYGLLTYNLSGSDVINWLPSVTVEYGEAADIVSLLEESSGADIYVDTSNVIQFRYQLKGNVGGRGFTIKNKKEANDDADDTAYFRGKNWGFDESIYKSEAYSQILYSILPPETQTFPATSQSYYDNKHTAPNTAEIAIKFAPSHSHWIPGDIYVFGQAFFDKAGSPSGFEDVPPSRFRICKDNAGVPLNTNGIVANIQFSANAFPNMFGIPVADRPFSWSNDQLFFNTSNTRIESFDLDTTKYYWLILSDTNVFSDPSGPELHWGKQVSGSNATYEITSDTDTMSTDANGGSGWASIGTPPPGFYMPRQRAHSMSIWNPIAMKHIHYAQPSITIGTTLSTLPSFVRSPAQWYKYMASQLQYMSRPRWNASSIRVSAPNVPIMPGDPLIISDSILGYSGPGNDYMIAKCGDMQYSFHTFDSGQSTGEESILTLNPVLTVPRLK